MTAPRWIYRVEIVDHVESGDLNAFGADGWELVAVTPLGAGRRELIFKRPAPDFRTRITLDQRAEVTGAIGEDTGEVTP